jgi:hypothetical protein
MSETAIGMYFVAGGIHVVIGPPLPLQRSVYVVDPLTRTLESRFGAT